ncbi:hypothetical protein D5S17_01130 [Pseudonocardiaceae bacterium YIM PH 21723]|nr:hypothetical protein D5S17_01130 [Pseudonocardiaceae bacterium YIM PH 21723]
MRRSAFIGACLLALGLVGSALPANAAAEPLTFAVDKTTAKHGETVTVTVTVTNTSTTPGQFGYLYFEPTYGTDFNQLKYEFTGCSGDISDCNAVGPNSHKGTLHPKVPIPAGGTETFALAYKIADDSPCGGTLSIGHNFWLYLETASGNIEKQGVAGPLTSVSC